MLVLGVEPGVQEPCWQDLQPGRFSQLQYAKCPMHSVGSAPLLTYLPTPTAQGTLLALVGEIFGIKTSFLGKIASNMARVSLLAFSWLLRLHHRLTCTLVVPLQIAMDTVVKTANDNHLRPWMQMCKVGRLSSMCHHDNFVHTLTPCAVCM